MNIHKTKALWWAMSTLLLSGMLMLSSCEKDYLKLDNPNSPYEDQFYTNVREAEFGLYGVYDAYQNNNLFGEMIPLFDQISDNLSNNNNSDGFRAFQTTTQDPLTNPRVREFYRHFYNVVNRANYVIDRVEKMTTAQIDETNRKRIIAEASFLRAFAYFMLTNLYRDIPVYTTPQNSFTQGKGPTKQADVYKFLEEDLTKVAPNLPVLVSEAGRASRGAAYTLLGQVYLYQKKYPETVATLKPLLSAPYKYDLFPDYTRLFLPSGEFSQESIFEINYAGTINDNGNGFAPTIDTTLQPTKPQQNLTPTPNLVDSYLYIDGKPHTNDTPTIALYGARSPLYNNAGVNRFANRDPRLRATVLTNADFTPGGKRLWNFAGNYAIKKYVEVTRTRYVNSPQNYYVYRFADVLLMYAEALNEVEGASPEVYAAVNRIRNRLKTSVGPAEQANFNFTYPAGLTQAQMRERIRDERRWEFALEWQRYFDLQRWGILKPKVEPSFTGNSILLPKSNVWPIPQPELDANPNMVQASEWR